MPTEYYCPRCQSQDIIDYDDHIECNKCHLNFSIEDIESGIEDEDILAQEELSGMVDSFEEFKDEKTRKKFLKSLKDDL